MYGILPTQKLSYNENDKTFKSSICLATILMTPGKYNSAIKCMPKNKNKVSSDFFVAMTRAKQLF